MRLSRYHLFLLGGLFAIVMGPLAFTQPGPPGGGMGGGMGGMGGMGGKGGKGNRSEFMFAMLSGGKESFSISAVQIPQMLQRFESADQTKEKMMAFLQKKGVTDGVMTKALYSDYSEERMTEMRAKWGQKGKDGGPPPPGGGTPVVVTPGAPPADPDAQAREIFKRLDSNGDGALSVEEMQAAGRMGSRIHDEREKWDRNKNGTIELDEFIEYFKSRTQRGGPPPATQPQADPVKPVVEDKRPVVYRVGKLPKGLPAWFEELDQDKDGQVGLYEWKSSGKSIGEFLALDHNGDGFITVEEVLRDQKANAMKTVATVNTSLGQRSMRDPSPGAASSGATDSSDGQRGKGNRGGRGKGRPNRGG